METSFPASKFRSPEAARILREHAANPNDFNLQRWTDQAIKDLSEFAHLATSRDGNQRRTWGRACRAVREGVELFADKTWPSCATAEGRSRPENAKDLIARAAFLDARFKDIKDMAILEANAAE